MKILAIDDYRDIDATYVARTYVEGVQKLMTERWDVLYLDGNLGGYQKSGIDVMYFLKENKQFAPRIILCISDSPGIKNMINGMIKDIYGRLFDYRDIESLKEAETKKERI